MESRCERMKKDCQPSPPVRKRTTAKKVTRSRTSKLEQKLDGLVQLLESAAKPATAASRMITDDLQAISISSDLAETPGITDPGLSESASSNVQLTGQPARGLDALDAELYLHNFRTEFAKHTPFVVIPASITAQQLRKDRPILWQCIMAIASNKVEQQIRFSKELRTTFGVEMFVEARKSMDLLLAVLVYATW